MNRTLPILLALMAACGETSLSDEAANGGISSPVDDLDAIEPLQGLRLDLVPTELPVSADVVTVLPQSFALPNIAVGLQFDAGLFRLEDPLEVNGVITSPDHAVTVPVAQLPGEGGTSSVSAMVRLDQPGTLQNYRASTDEQGAVTLFVMPNTVYQATIVPENPALPITAFPWEPGDSFDIELDYGVSIYGRAVFEDEDGNRTPLVDASVYALTPGNVRSTLATTDASGFFHLAVQPGAYTLVCEGRAFGQDPVLTASDVEVGDEGLAIDFVYQDVDSVVVDGRVLAESGAPAQGVAVRLTATSLVGLRGLPATYTTEKLTDADGGFLARVPPGVYKVELLPASVRQGDDFTPSELPSVEIDGDLDLGSITMLDAQKVTGTIADDGQSRVAGAVVACREQRYGQRSWTTVSDDEGRFTLNLPQVPLDCAITPPSDRADLALTRRTFDPATAKSPTLRLTEGQTVIGQVARGDAPEPYVVVEVRDGDGLLLGSALTDDKGEWSLQIDPQR